MSEQQHKDLVQLLTSKSISWTKRVKLVRYAWANNAAVIPNKKPFLLHLVTTVLVNRRKELSVDEIDALWRCSRDILQAACQHISNGTASDVFSLKAGFVQLVVAELQNIASSTCIDADHCATVVSCCHLLATSVLLGLDLTSKFENMLKLLTSVLQLLLRSEDEQLKDVKKSLESLLIAAVPHYAACQRQRPSSQQVAISICSKLFVLYIRFDHYINLHSLLLLNPDFRSCHEELEECLVTAVFSKELLPHHSAFLQRKVGKSETGWKESRFITVLFDALISGYLAEETRSAFIEGIVWIYRKFTLCYRDKDADLPLMFLCYLTETFCFGASLHVSNGTDASVVPELPEKSQQLGMELILDRLKVLHLLLKATLVLNTFDAVHDMAQDSKMLHWFQAVAAWLLQQNSRCPDWFNCMQHLLLLAPTIVEGRLVGIINAAWTTDDGMVLGEVQRARDDLLVEIVRTYTRLRHISRLVHAMLLAIRISERRVQFSSSFRDSLRSCFADLDQMTVVNVWSEINQELSSEYSDEFSKSFSSLKLEAVCELTTMYMLNVTATGHSITQITDSKLGTLLHATVQHALAQLHVICFKRKMAAEACSLMKLLHACGKMLLLRRIYGSVGDVSQNVQSESINRDFHDLSLLHPIWEPKRWSKFHSFVTGSKNIELLLHWEKLLIQGLQYDQYCCQDIPHRLCQQVNDFLLLGDHWDLSTIATCSSKPLDTMEYAVSHWSTITENAVLLFPASSWQNVHVEAVAKFMLHAVISLSNDDTQWNSLRGLVHDFISSPTFLEMHLLHVCLTNIIIDQIFRSLTTNNASKPKRRKHSIEHEKLMKAVAVIRDGNNKLVVSCQDGVDIPAEVIAVLNELLDEKEVIESLVMSDETLKQLFALLQLLKLLPLEFLDIVSQVRCLLCMILVTTTAVYAASQETNDTNRQKVLADIFKIVQCLLFDGRGMHALMTAVNSGLLLLWFHELQRQLTIQNAECVDLLRSCDSLLKQLIRLSTKHSTMIMHLNDFVQKIRHQLRDNRKCENDDQVMKFTFRTLSAILEILTKVLRRPYVRPENRDAFCAMSDSISQEFSRALAHLSDCSSELMSANDDDVASSWILLGYSCQLEYVLLLHGSAVVEDNAKVRNKVLKFLPEMCDKCLHHLRLTENFDMLTNCLRFIFALCAGHSGLGDQLPRDFLLRVWPLVLGRLQKLDRSISQLVENNSTAHTFGNNERTYLETTLAALIKVYESDDIIRHLEELVHDMESSDANRVHAALQVFNRITTAIVQYPKDVLKIILPNCQKVLLKIQRMLIEEKADQYVVVAALHLKTAMLSVSWTVDGQTRPVVTSSMMSLCLHPCIAVESHWVNTESLVAVCTAWYGVLNAALIYHSNIVYHMIPAYVGGVRQLLRAVIQAGTQPTDIGKQYANVQLDQIMDCVRLFDRLASLICSHKINFAKAAPYIIADYVNMAQKVTLFPVVKRTLLLAMYKLLDICSEHTVKQLNAVLPPGAREVFRLVYANFDKYYRYSKRTADEDQRNVEFIRTVYSN